MQVANLDGIFHDLVTHLVGLAMGDSGLDSATGHPDGERAGVVVSAHIFHLLAIPVFPHRRPAELSAPDDEGVLEHATLFQIGKQRRSRLIDLAATIGEAEIQTLPSRQPRGNPIPSDKAE